MYESFRLNVAVTLPLQSGANPHPKFTEAVLKALLRCTKMLPSLLQTNTVNMDALMLDLHQFLGRQLVYIIFFMLTFTF